MSNYRRAYVPGGTFFITLVTHNRRPLFADADNVARLRRALIRIRQEQPFEVVAAVVLPDHLHFVWTLPAADPNFSKRVGRLKVLFTQSFSGRQASPPNRSFSRIKHRESDVWQRRFWEHTIRDDHDFQRHLDYIHYNPVKHGLVRCPHAWEATSFRRWVQNGGYSADWCCTCDGQQRSVPDFGAMEKTVGE